MAFDGIFLNQLCHEMTFLQGARVEKVFQPMREEIILLLRTRQGPYRLLISARADAPRMHITQIKTENPKSPPMLCMLLRKKLCGSVLQQMDQAGHDRVVF